MMTLRLVSPPRFWELFVSPRPLTARTFKVWLLEGSVSPSLLRSDTRFENVVVRPLIRPLYSSYGGLSNFNAPRPIVCRFLYILPGWVCLFAAFVL